MLKDSIFYFILISITYLSCNSNDEQSSINPIQSDTLLLFNCGDSVNVNCSDKVIVNTDLYDSARSNANVAYINITEDCLNVEYGGSGCDGSTWVLTLVDSGYFVKNNPITRKLKWDFYNNEGCLAVFTKEKSFDLCPLKIPGEDSLILQIEDSSYVYRF